MTSVLDEIIAKNLPINDLLYFNDQPDEATRPYRLRFDENVEIPNSYPAESWRGRDFRWLGPETSTTLTIPRDRSVGYDLVIAVAHYTGGDGSLAATTILVDGEVVGSRVSGDGADRIITAVIPPLKTALQFPAFLLTIEYPRPSQLREPAARVVTLAISQITITPRR